MKENTLDAYLYSIIIIWELIIGIGCVIVIFTIIKYLLKAEDEEE